MLLLPTSFIAAYSAWLRSTMPDASDAFLNDTASLTRHAFLYAAPSTRSLYFR